MKTNTLAPNYKGFRFPPEIIGYAVWPLLCTVVWKGSADRRDPQAQQKVLSALHYETPEQVYRRYLAASDLTQSLWDIFKKLEKDR